VAPRRSIWVHQKLGYKNGCTFRKLLYKKSRKKLMKMNKLNFKKRTHDNKSTKDELLNVKKYF